ncbi:hypothetical protein HAX54_044563, partial [Datura stramonium]|nr:hypothetical protein [Datura stramonium]
MTLILMGKWRRTVMGLLMARVFKSKREDEKNYDKDPELAEILGSCLDDPDIAKSREVGLLPSANSS